MIRVTSVGLEASEVGRNAMNTMNEVGVDISRQTSKALSQFDPENFDIVISCGSDLSFPSQWQVQQKLEAKLLESLESGEPVDITPEFWEQRRQALMNRMKERQQ